jgi:hypothetical protein
MPRHGSHLFYLDGILPVHILGVAQQFSRALRPGEGGHGNHSPDIPLCLIPFPLPPFRQINPLVLPNSLSSSDSPSHSITLGFNRDSRWF